MKRILMMAVAALFSFAVFAQDGGATNVDVNLGSDGGGAGFPWLWVIGGLVFVILLVALLSGRSGGTDRVVEKRTVVKD